MAGAQHLLRKAALEKMSSPEQLDMAMRVTSPASWIALAAFGVLIVTAVVFSIVGRMPIKIDSSGILLRGDQVQTIQVVANGVIDRLDVKEGDLIEEGQVVAHLDLPELEGEIRASKDRISDLTSQGEVRTSQMTSLRQSYQQQINELYSRRRNIESLVERQIKTRNDLAAIDAQISSIRAQMVQSDAGETQRENQVAEERRRLEQLEERLEAGSKVKSPHRGRVAAVLKSQGQVIQQGERLVNLEEPDAPFHVLLFVPFSEGKKVRPGMQVRISPSTVKPEEYGFVVGTVESMSSQPVTPEEVRATLNNDQLANRFAQDTPFRVRASPELDESTLSGFRWTSSSGPPHPIGGNTPCSAQIIIDKRRPISYVIPTVKKTLGIGG
jgi:HlyD family secretion protein